MCQTTVVTPSDLETEGDSISVSSSSSQVEGSVASIARAGETGPGTLQERQQLGVAALSSQVNPLVSLASETVRPGGVSQHQPRHAQPPHLTRLVNTRLSWAHNSQIESLKAQEWDFPTMNVSYVHLSPGRYHNLHSVQMILSHCPEEKAVKSGLTHLMLTCGEKSPPPGRALC